MVGSGGREHAICLALSKSSRKPKLFCAPGNAGISQLAECIDVKAEDVVGLVKWAKDHKPNLIVIGPDSPFHGLGRSPDQRRLSSIWPDPRRRPNGIKQSLH
ncbi:MAG TPA: phosphoribosylamine--glycine ligase N-terminal domain-containing protein [bacterium]